MSQLATQNILPRHPSNSNTDSHNVGSTGNVFTHQGSSSSLLTAEDIPSNILKEAQTTISVAIADSLFRQSGGTTYSLKEIYECFASAFHQGGELSETFLRGDGLFEPLFTKHLGNNLLSLNWKLTRRRDAEFIVGRSLTKRQLLSATKSQKNPVSGTTLWKMYEKAHCHCLLAYQLSKSYLIWKGNADSSGTEIASLPEGKTEEDFINYLLEKMYEELEIKGNKENDDDKGLSTSMRSSTCDKRWFFPGFWAFMLFGPLAKPESRSQLLLKPDPWGLVGRSKGTFSNTINAGILYNNEHMSSAIIANKVTQTRSELPVNVAMNSKSSNNSNASLSSPYTNHLHSSSPYLLARDVPKIMKESQTTIAFAIASALYDEGHCSHQKDLFAKFHEAFHDTFEIVGPKAPSFAPAKDEIQVNEMRKSNIISEDNEKTLTNTDTDEKDVTVKKQDAEDENQHHKPRAEKRDENNENIAARAKEIDGAELKDRKSNSMVDLFLSGGGPFSRLVNRDNSGNLDIRSTFSRRSVVIRMGQTITKSRLITAKQENLILGRSLFAQYERAHKNCQKAYAIWEEYDLMKEAVIRNDNKREGGKMTDDNSADEIFVTHLLDRMFEYLEIEKRKQRVGSGNHPVVDLVNDDETGPNKDKCLSYQHHTDEAINTAYMQNLRKRDEKWFFTGFWAFMLFGPLAPSAERSKLMENDVHSLLARKYSKENSQAHHHELKEQLSGNSKNINIATPISLASARQNPPPTFLTSSLGTIFKRSMTGEERVNLIQLAQRQEDITTKNEELQFLALNCQLKSLGEELKASIEIAKVLGSNSIDPDPDHCLWKEVKSLQSQMKKKRTELEDLTRNKRRRLEGPISSNSLTDAHIKSLTNGHYFSRYNNIVHKNNNNEQIR